MVRPDGCLVSGLIKATPGAGSGLSLPSVSKLSGCRRKPSGRLVA